MVMIGWWYFVYFEYDMRSAECAYSRIGAEGCLRLGLFYKCGCNYVDPPTVVVKNVVNRD